MAQVLEDTFLSLLPKVDGKPKIEIGSVLIESKLFEGPLGGSFLGHYSGLGVPVVVRVLHPRVKAQLKEYHRFEHETRKLGQVRHSSIAGVLDTGEHHGHPYIVIEYVSGIPLTERIKTRPLSEAHALDLLLPLAEGLRELWRKGHVHRGVCPDIIHIQPDGTVKMDLTVLRRNYTDPQFKSYLAPVHSPYWAPEELRGQAVDPTADMWSFGATLYHAVTGKLPFSPSRDGLMQVSALIEDPIDPKVANKDIHEPMRMVLLKLLSKNFEDRFINAESFLTALYQLNAQISGKSAIAKTMLYSEMPPEDLEGGAPIGAGAIIGNCRIVKKLGEGAFGVVYLARHKVLDIDVAIKLLPAAAAFRDPGYVEMFLREARTAARIRHKNVIGIFEAGVQEGQHYIIMELAPGGTVGERMFLQGGKLPPDEVSRILLESARGLAAAERLNIVHRDIKPDNLMYSADGEIKIADLGLAKRLAIPGATGTIRASLMADQLSMKNDPVIVGTPAYMAPEIAVEPAKADTRADLYSLGVTAYHMLTGQLPFEGKSPMETIMKHVLDAPVPPIEMDSTIPEELNGIVLKLMQKKPADRFQSSQDLVKALEYRLVAEGMMATF